ncbi:uncharacterized protein METZ01_LOCUS222824 [marine metagenome]|uniref:5'-3' exonuclease domain-containing protein n=1 Tax=marine metagenome TaxID=408172 RepID=A0A382G3W7_9ZZZZ
MMNKKAMSEDFVRHAVLNTIRMYHYKFTKEYGELVVCCDAPDNWRKDAFKYYKAQRKTTRDKSDFDWSELFRLLHKIREEISENFPYKVIYIEGAEADDIIATIVMDQEHKTERMLSEFPILILSSDKDFIQLQKYPNVDQYSPLTKKFLNTDNPDTFLREHILRGDTSDGVPNFLSSDDTFVTDKRQTPLSKKKVSVWSELEPDVFCQGEQLRNYRRNEMLIDFTKIPEWLQINIVDEYVNQPAVDRSRLFNYFIKYKLKNLMEHINEF